MKTFHLFRLAACFILPVADAGCRHAIKTEEPAEAKVSGEKISFPAGSPQLAAFTVEPIESHAPVTASLPGRLIWNDDVTVRVFTPFAGRVRQSPVSVGETVEPGTPLADVESPDFGQAQTDARKAASDLQLAQRNLTRLHELFAHGAAAQKDVDAAEADAARADSERDRAVSRLTAYGASADSVNEVFILRSPLAGTIVEKNINPGQEIRPDQMLANMPQYTAPLFVISDPSRLWIQIDASEIDLPRLRSGREFVFTSRAFPEQTFTGRVDVVAQSIDPNTHMIKVRGTVDNARGLLKAEMFVSVNVPDGSAPIVGVPSNAVFLKGEKHYVFVEEEPGQFERQEVKVGSEQNGQIVVFSGVQAGQRVVTNGSILLQQMMD
jgi:cobalt-zinc-cadmium efflux system membrane fusion protein